MLSNTYSKLDRNSTAEIQFRRAVLTFEGVKADAIFAYRPPFNVLALLILLPLKLMTSARWFHKVNVTAIRVLNAPILLMISLFERRFLWQRNRNLGPTHRQKWLGFWESFGAHADLQAVFEQDPPQSVLDDMDDIDNVFSNDVWGNGYINAMRVRRGSRNISEGTGPFQGVGRNATTRRRGDSMAPSMMPAHMDSW